MPLSEVKEKFIDFIEGLDYDEVKEVFSSIKFRIDKKGNVSYVGTADVSLNRLNVVIDEKNKILSANWG